ncbi:hypothetical protein N5T01_00115 [Escherichia coli]|uniref:hypothetical protein n=1 Tax=Escherichia coli TaxID=562 RepID=UPI002226DCC5|nr:hypothetical protein [Escherichia coli]MCW3287798.1 hypothetical protein [Escherichia coli]
MATLQELIDLTPEQEKAWNRLVKAVKDFRAAGGKFYSVLDTLSAYNGEHVANIDNDKGYHTASVYMPSIDAPGLTSWADDWHGNYRCCFSLMKRIDPPCFFSKYAAICATFLH